MFLKCIFKQQGLHLTHNFGHLLSCRMGHHTRLSGNIASSVIAAPVNKVIYDSSNMSKVFLIMADYACMIILIFYVIRIHAHIIITVPKGQWLLEPLTTVSQLAESCQLVVPKEGVGCPHLALLVWAVGWEIQWLHTGSFDPGHWCDPPIMGILPVICL